MNKLILTSLFFLILNFSIFSSDKEKLNTVDSQINYLINEHFKNISTIFQTNQNQFDNFDKIFFSDFNFINSDNTKNFFHSIKADLDAGKFPNHLGATYYSYTSYSNINGKVTGVTYEYNSDGKNIILTKGTLHNGKLLKATYHYNPESKKLDTYEVKGNKVIQKNTYTLEV